MTRLHDLWRRARRPDAAADADLLRRFDRTGDEAAFAELVVRYGPVVYGACRRQLADPADVEDAFQATFLVLVTRASSLSGDGLGPWLYRVAVLTARNLRRRNARRAVVALSSQLPAPAPPSVDLRLDLDAALMALPARDRTPVVLCYLRGWSRREAALHLGCPEGTLSARLSRALVKLRRRLAGADPVVVLAAAGVTVPAATADAAVRSAVLFHASSRSAAALTPAVADLTRGVLRMFWVKKVVAAGFAIMAVAAAGLGVGLTGAAGPQASAQAPPQPVSPTAPSADWLKARRDLLDQEVQQAKAQMQAAQAQLRRLDALKADLDERIRREAEAERKTATEAHLQVVVADVRDGQPPSIFVKEYDEGLTAPPRAAGLDSSNPLHLSTFHQSGITACCADVRNLRKHLARIRKDPTAPTKLVVRVDAKDPANKDRVAAVVAVCREAGFATCEVTPSGSPQKPTAAGPAVAPRSYVVEPPDVLKLDAYVRVIPDNAPTDPNGVLLKLPVRSLRSGNHLVRPDGTVSLGQYGEVSVTGLTIAEVTAAVRKHLSEQKDVFRREKDMSESLVVVIDVVAYNSKKCYVILDDPNGNGEQVTALPITGSDTVLDVLSSINGLTAGGKSQIWVARPSPTPGEQPQVLPVDWVGITQHGATATNYRILPGDRVYVKKKPAAASGP